MCFSVYQVAVLLKGHAHVNVVNRRHDESQGESPLVAGEYPTMPTSLLYLFSFLFSLLLLLGLSVNISDNNLLFLQSLIILFPLLFIIIHC